MNKKELLNQFDQYKQGTTAQPQGLQQNTCPNCGYCPHCGRGGQNTLPYYPTYPIYPQPYYGPMWISTPTVTTNTPASLGGWQG